jgi:hypothetical protein
MTTLPQACLRDHRRGELAREEEGRAEVHRHDLVPLDERDVGRGAEARDAGVVDEDVDGAPVGKRTASSGDCAVRVGHVGADGEAAAALRFHGGGSLTQTILVPGDGDDVGTSLGEDLADAEADALGGAYHQSLAARQREAVAPVGGEVGHVAPPGPALSQG